MPREAVEADAASGGGCEQARLVEAVREVQRFVPPGRAVVGLHGRQVPADGVEQVLATRGVALAGAAQVAIKLAAGM